jgi:hypothetical protein
MLAPGIATGQSTTPPGSSHRIRLTSQKITLPFGKSVFAGGDRAELANARCLVCHSRDMIDAQPALALEVWKKEIDKMRTAYGCPIGADQTDALAEFISQAARTPASDSPK